LAFAGDSTITKFFAIDRIYGNKSRSIFLF
jgi:hypothetical protein